MYARNEPAMQDNGSEGKCSSLLFTLLSVYEASSTLVQILIPLHACMHESFGCGRNFISGLINFKVKVGHMK